MLSLGGATYTLGSIVLYKSWYEDFPRSGFHFHNDLGEWRGMDKSGHVFSTYVQSELWYQGWRSANVPETKAVWSGAACGLLFQSTVEVMDGFSEGWGFSWSDMGANVLGSGMMVGQQLLWQEQRIRFKTSMSPQSYRLYPQGAEMQAILDQRIDAIYGRGLLQRWLKDYNGQTTWLSANLRSFFPRSALPTWLNVSLGYGAQNMLGGYSNSWEHNGQLHAIDPSEYPRYSQFYISLDVDLSRIETQSPLLRTLLDILNVLKMPFSALEINTEGQIKFHILAF